MYLLFYISPFFPPQTPSPRLLSHNIDIEKNRPKSQRWGLTANLNLIENEK